MVLKCTLQVVCATGRLHILLCFQKKKNTLIEWHSFGEVSVNNTVKKP